MKITAQKVFVANVQRTNLVFVKLYTDEGIEGVGEATLEWKTLAMVATLEELERVVVGRDPFQTDALIEQLHRDSYWRTGALFRTALGAIEAAMLDIKGKALGVPVYELLGGRYRDRIKCYANHWFFGAETPDNYATKARKAVGMGYKGLKWDPFEDFDLEMSKAELHRAVEVVEAVRDAVGPGIDLMLDVHGRFNVPTAIAMCKAMAPLDLTWIEEPVPPEAIDALAEVRRHSPVPIASGERWYEPGTHLEALRKNAVDIVQPDVSHAGGMAETKRIAHMAHLHMIPVAPHNPVGPVMNAMTLHTALAIPNFTVFETVSIDVPWRKELVTESLVFDNGDLLAPTVPGLGVELNEAACARYPYEPYNTPIFNGTMSSAGVKVGNEVMAGRAPRKAAAKKAPAKAAGKAAPKRRS